jgi:predicted aldo/keto reductase-like oxidoreductase
MKHINITKSIKFFVNSFYKRQIIYAIIRWCKKFEAILVILYGENTCRALADKTVRLFNASNRKHLNNKKSIHNLFFITKIY